MNTMHNGKLIEKAYDSLGNDIEIWLSETLVNSEAMVLFLKTYTEIMEKGWATMYFPWGDSNKYSVLYARDSGGNVIAGIAYEYRPLMKEGWILLSFTKTEFRGRHLNGILHDYFETMMRNKGALRLASHIHKDNLSALRSAEKVGRIPEYYRLQKDLN